MTGRSLAAPAELQAGAAWVPARLGRVKTHRTRDVDNKRSKREDQAGRRRRRMINTASFGTSKVKLSLNKRKSD